MLTTVESILEDTKRKMKQSADSLKKDLATIRTGRANPAILDTVQAECYGSTMPISQLAGISVPEPSCLLIHPFDKSSLKAIETAILKSDLGLNPANDGSVIRLPIPALTEERRKELTKMANRMGESIKTAIRNVRRDQNDSVKKLEKDKSAGLSEDASKKALEHIQKITDDFIKEVEATVKSKEAEIMKV